MMGSNLVITLSPSMFNTLMRILYYVRGSFGDSLRAQQLINRLALDVEGGNIDAILGAAYTVSDQRSDRREFMRRVIDPISCALSQWIEPEARMTRDALVQKYATNQGRQERTPEYALAVASAAGRTNSRMNTIAWICGTMYVVITISSVGVSIYYRDEEEPTNGWLDWSAPSIARSSAIVTTNVFGTRLARYGIEKCAPNCFGRPLVMMISLALFMGIMSVLIGRFVDF